MNIRPTRLLIGLQGLLRGTLDNQQKDYDCSGLISRVNSRGYEAESIIKIDDRFLRMKGRRLDGFNIALNSYVNFSYFPDMGQYGVLETKIMNPMLQSWIYPRECPAGGTLVIVEGFQNPITGNVNEAYLERMNIKNRDNNPSQPLQKEKLGVLEMDSGNRYSLSESLENPRDREVITNKYHTSLKLNGFRSTDNTELF